MQLSGPPAAPGGPTSRLADLRRRVRRAVLRRRRPLAALLAAVAVAAGLQAVAAPPPPSVPVLVAGRDLPAGTRLRADDVRTAELEPALRPAGAVDDPVGRVLAGPVRDGEPITDVRLVGPDLTEGVPGRTAVPVRLPDAAMAALLEPGDRIDLVAADPRGGSADLVAEDAVVLALPSAEHDPQVAAAELPGRLVVLGVSPAEVDAVWSAAAGSFLGYTW